MKDKSKTIAEVMRDELLALIIFTDKNPLGDVRESCDNFIDRWLNPHIRNLPYHGIGENIER